MDNVGKYRILRLIGEGGMASVYAAEHELLGTKAAVKVLKPELSVNPQIRERFRNEARHMALLSHPNIAKVIDFDEQPQQLSIIMELLEGENLGSRIRRAGPIGETELRDIFGKMLAALQYAHEKGVVHRDIKPSNIFLTSDRQVKLLDFGIAKVYGQGQELTLTGQQMGTPVFMSPEQVKSDKTIDHRTDIYSLGVTMYFAVVGRPPYDAATDSQFDIFNKIVYEPIPHIQGKDGISQMINKACRKERDQRYQSCNDWNVELIGYNLENETSKHKSHGIDRDYRSVTFPTSSNDNTSPQATNYDVNKSDYQNEYGSRILENPVGGNAANSSQSGSGSSEHKESDDNKLKPDNSRNNKTSGSYDAGKMIGSKILSFLKQAFPYLLSIPLVGQVNQLLPYGDVRKYTNLFGVVVCIYFLQRNHKIQKKINILYAIISLFATYYFAFLYQSMKIKNLSGKINIGWDLNIRHGDKRLEGDYWVVLDDCEKHWPTVIYPGDQYEGDVINNEIFHDFAFCSRDIDVISRQIEFDNLTTMSRNPDGTLAIEKINAKYFIQKYSLHTGISDFVSVFKPKIFGTSYEVSMPDCSPSTPDGSNEYQCEVVPRNSRLHYLLEGEPYPDRERDIKAEIIKNYSKK